jgi:creatinine amidohydrolase
MLNDRSTADEIVASGTRTAVLPIGSTEQHGAHLPVGTDNRIAEAVAAAFAERTGAWLLPVLPISTCREHLGKKGSVGVTAATFLALLKDVAASLEAEGFDRLVLVVGHGGVFVAGPATREIDSDGGPLKVIRVDLVAAMESPEAAAILETCGNLHACEYETSLMLHLDPDAVHMERAVDCVPDAPRDALNYAPIFRFSPSGVWGTPSLATKGKGERLFAMLVDWTMRYVARVEGILGGR